MKNTKARKTKARTHVSLRLTVDQAQRLYDFLNYVHIRENGKVEVDAPCREYLAGSNIDQEVFDVLVDQEVFDMLEDLGFDDL